MKLTKKLEVEILKVYNTVWDAYLRGDMRTFASTLDENCYIIGSAAGEVFKNKKAAVKYYKSTAEQITGKAEFRNRKIKVMPVEKGFMVNEEADFYLLIDDQWTFYGPARISSLFHKKNNKWKVVHQHGSFPDSKTEEGEQVNTDKIKAENIQLRDAVKRRTEELENKNRELEIEAALERVRARAMAMQSSEELIEVANVMRQQMVELGQSGFDTAAVHLYSDDPDYFDSWYSFRQGDPVTGKIVTGKTKFKKDACKMLREMVKAYHSNENDYTLKASGEKLREWFSLLTKAIPEIKINLDKNPGSNYIHFSDFSGGSLVMATFQPPTKDSMLLQKRCAAVFDLAYRRYMDLKKAEAQVREAQIEAALERVRSRSMAMYKSDDLHEVIKVVVEQLSVLSVKFNVSNFAKIDPDGSWDLWLSTPDQTYPALIHVPYIDHPIFSRITDEGTKRNDFFTDVYPREEANIFFHHFFENTIAKNTPEERKQFVYNSKGFARSIFLTKNIWFSVSRYDTTPFTDEENAIFKRFAKVFEQAYTRFLDLQKAEAQARETEIELSLERVRAKAMAMQKPSEFVDVINIIGEQLIHLGFDIDWANFGANGFDISEGIDIWNFGVVPGASPISARVFFPYFDHPVFTTAAENVNEFLNGGRDLITVTLDKQAKDTWLDHMFTKTIFKDIPEEYRVIQYGKPGYTTSNISLKDTWLSIGKFDIKNFTDEQHAIFRRFANAFGQAYTRFLDLQKAETQARESEIELSLERVRAKTMAMQKPSEFLDVINIIGEQFVHLGFDIEWANFGANGLEISKGFDIWNFAVIPGSPPISARVFIPYFDHPLFTNATEELDKYLRTGNDLFILALSKEDKDRWLDHLFTKTAFKEIPDDYRAIQYAKAGYTTSNIALKDTWFSIGKFDPRPFTDEQHSILRRFAKAFGQAYTRFQDLQNAEAQAKEAQIEAALERVRARSMAMHHSSELHAAADVLFQQLRIFGGDIMNAGIALCTQDADEDEYWLSSDSGLRPVISIPHTEDSVQKKLYEDWKNKSEFFSIAKEGDELKAHYNYMQSVPSLKPFFKEGPDWSFPTWQKWHAAYFSHGYLFMITLKPYEEEKILVRFAKVFEQAYTRFLDLQKAEAQAREAQIEAGLERVRSRAMAMQNSDELKELIGTVFTELTKLDIVLTRCLIMIYDPRSNDSVWWMANSEAPTQPIGLKVQYHEYPSYLAYVNAWKQKELKWTYTLEGNTKKEWDDFLFVETELSHLPDFVIAGMKAPDRVYLNASFNSFGNLTLATLEPLSGEHFDIMLRFAKVFDLTYTRFNDLQKAEAQTREAQIELALERVRARTMAMHKSEELSETAEVLYHQLKILGDSPERITIGILNEDNGIITWWATDQGGNQLNIRFEATIEEPTVMLRLYNNWKAKNKSLVIDLIGKELSDWVKYCREVIGVPIKEELLKNRRVQTASFFSHGWVMITSPELLDTESINVLERFASVFNLTYRRFLDLQKAEAQANEARIEIALERIRARALAMHKSDELMEVANVLREQMALLGQPELESSVVHLYEEDPDNILSWRSFRALDPHSRIAYGHMAIPKNCCEVVREWLTKFYSDLKEYTIEISGAKQEEWYEILFKLAPDVINSMRQENSIHEKRYYRFSKFSGGALLMVSKQEPSEEVTYLQKRAAVVFDLAYRRFSDLQKAEAQAREAQIETALEKVRSRSLAMHKSDELQEVVDTVFERLQELNIEMASANIAIFKEGTRNYDYWIASPAQKRSASFHMPYIDLSLTRDLIAARESGKEFSTTAYSFEEKNEWFGYAFKETDFKFLSEERKQFILNSPGITVAIAFSKNTGVQVNRYNSKLYTEGEGEILKRFSKVFEQAYIRFLDLEKAEAQAREAQIETVLERVRSRTMAMQKSDELTDVAGLLFEQVSALGIKTWTAGFNVWGEDNNSYVDYITSPQGGFIEPYTVYTDTAEALTDISNARKSGVEFDVQYVEGEKIKQLYLALTKLDEKQYEVMLQDGVRFPSHQYEHFVFGSKVSLMFITYEPVPEAHDIFKRLGKVFEQTYTRFLDLQRAEAQTREAQIEASLERVRASAMAMHRSDELSNVLAILFEQFDVLKIQPVDVHLDLFDLEKNTFSYRATGKEGKRVIAEQIVDLDSRPEWQALLQKWKNGKPNTVDFSYYPKEVIRDLMAFFPDIWAAMPEDAVMSPEDFPNGIFDALGYCKFGYIGFHHHRKATEEEQRILVRFANEFERLYQRFLDLQKAEAQAREAQIEASLERVRSKTMAMHNSQDVGETVATMFDELVKLGVETVRCGIAIIDESKAMEVWTASTKEDGSVRLIIGQLDMSTHPLFMQVYDAWKNKQPVTTYELIGEDLKDYFRNINNSPNYPIRYDIEALPYRQSNTAFMFPEGSLFVFSQEPLVTETTQIFKRFAGVFGQTYRRYLDLQKAEANAREAQIEAGLERVRAKAMAMHSSKDLAETLSVFYRELKSLSVVPIRCGVALMDKESRMAELTTMNTTGEGDSIEIIGKIKMAGHPVLDGVFESWLVQKEYHTVLRGNQIKEYYQVLKPQIDYLDYSHDEAQFGYYFMFNEGDVYAWTEKELTEDELTIYRRFTTVISLTYKRYKDLQQAEAQAREAKIEAGLERVRARTMAMHNSEDVGAATATMFTELEKLGIQNLRGGITIIKAGDKQEVWGITNLPDGRTIRSIGEFDMHLHALWRELLKAKVNNGDYNYYRLAGKDKEDYINILNTTPSYLSQPIKDFPDVHVQSYFFGEGAIWTNSLEPHSEEDKLVMKRFASVFSLTFRRYQDLKKAEAQTREATIETALEKVRGKAMAMHNSNDLTATASLVFTELRKLDISPMRCGVGILNKENRKALLYTAIASEEGDSLSQIGWVLLDVDPVLRSIYEYWSRGEDYFPVLKKEMLRSFYEQLKSGFEVPEEQTKYEHHGYFLTFSEGVFYGWGEKPFTESEIKVLKRFASVIDLTFRRYIELQKSEANAREAVKQAALDRVRAEIASMRTINDLDRITPLIWNELNILGIPFIRCGVFIMDNEQQLIHTFLSTPDGKAIAAFHLPYNTPGNLAHVVANWKKNKKYIDHWDETEFIQFADILVKEGALVSSEQYLKTIPKGGFYLHFLPFLQGMLYVGNTNQLKEEEIELIQHVADAFSTAYARYEDFNKLESAKQQVEKTLTDLKQAQTQLVQAEKMASLGELTAGIAHEIQNPLNFVNNFSEVSKELLDEMKTELESGNTEDAKDIADDVIQNLEKINHHGKRADAIVKSMLQHSRSSSGKKEPTDINSLADEYLRLAYHGLRAKDKSFNAKFETEFDNSIGKINIISQDIGRVLVNLINNAFYAVSERKKQESNGYEPTVEVFTKKIDDKIEIKVKDNGNGIPKKVLDKIFQPFFTTKPTGQGTGLGLSLAYDIITKGHSGELKVETKEGEGTEFIIQLPNQSS